MTDETREYLCGLLKEESDRRQTADEQLGKRLDTIDQSLTANKKAVESIQAKLLGTKGFVLLVITALATVGPELLKILQSLGH